MRDIMSRGFSKVSRLHDGGQRYQIRNFLSIVDCIKVHRNGIDRAK